MKKTVGKKKSVRRRPAEKRYSTDTLMLGLWKHLHLDFRSAHGNPLYANDAHEALCESVSAFRGYKFPARLGAPPFVFKTDYQLEALFKRYTFKSDVYTDDELETMTNDKFVQLQLELAAPRKEPSEFCFRVLQKARQLVKQALGPYDAEEHMQKCRFGKRACKGTPARNAYLDSKLENLSGSPEHMMWFYESYLPTDKILSDLVYSVKKFTIGQVCGSLDMTNVPKSWKIKRGICPNTSIGSFYTYGLGAMFQDRLKDSLKLDIRTCQSRHGRLARRYSGTREGVTVDLKNASNSYIFQLLCRLLPRDWLSAIKFGRLKYTGIKNPVSGITEQIYTCSYMMMGVGYTFTLQTLLFHSLIKAVQHLLGDTNGIVSVYGDDLIYPRKIHRYVNAALIGIGFQINQDKTFVDEYFRESCGSDFYRRQDVRPFQPEGTYQMLRPKAYALRVYQMINGLKERWAEAEIPQTLLWLYGEILRVDRAIFQVPPHFPDYSGVRVDTIRKEFWMPWVKPDFDTQNYTYTFACYTYKPHDRPVVREYAYYWEAMRSTSHRECWSPYELLEDKAKIISFIECNHQPKNYRSFVSRKRIKKLAACIARKGAQKTEVAHLSSLTSFEDSHTPDMNYLDSVFAGLVEKRLWASKKLVSLPSVVIQAWAKSTA